MSTFIQTIALVDAPFIAFHGYYPEEQILGHTFLVGIEASWNPEVVDTEELTSTLNYEELYSLAQRAMKTPRKLLETVALEMLNELRKQFAYLSDILVQIKKIHPPFGGESSQTMVKYHWKA